MNVFSSSLLVLVVPLPWTAGAKVKLGNEVLTNGHFEVR